MELTKSNGESGGMTSSSSRSDHSLLPLHKAAFEGNVRELAAFLRQGDDVAQKDKHGNTALHIAVMLGHKECVQILLAHGAPVKAKNLKGWSTLAESISYGDRPTIISLFRKSKQQIREQMSSRRPHLIKALERIQDFYMELKWDFQSWVPLVSRILPSDICKIYKRGSSIRLDTTLLDFNDMKWERGDISFVFNGNHVHHKIGGGNNNYSPLVVMDNKLKVFQLMTNKESEMEFDDEIDLLMSSDIIVAQLVTKEVQFARSQSGWIFREDKWEMVGPFKSEVYGVSGISLDTRKRREHLSEEDLQKNKELNIESLTKSSPSNFELSSDDYNRRESLPPPPRPEITWDEYILAEPGSPPHLGRPQMCKTSSKAFKATMAMSEDFPMTVEMLLNILEIVTPFKHLKKLREFVTMKLPPGFPVKIEIPILPTITAKITFQEFEFRDNLAEENFQIPSDYCEKRNRFPDL
ncbi:ankyrin repeat domain-containing protein 13C [Folsomia candida]|uniref:ankyrin repeat domain-containing protein 13C n=1 Tax=Folsomia candida TaxID=158441 RepID=UPI000B8FACAD|nr:ankyrin repeat domain-containing protein 13C [Folsomia candida]